MTHEIALVIPVFNEVEGIIQTLNSFSRGASGRVIFVVVDNNSTDSTVDIIKIWHKNHPEQDLVILHQDKKGSIYARKKGLLFAKSLAPIVVSTDADCKPDKDFYLTLTQLFATQPCPSVLKGHLRHSAKVRLLKQLYLSELMKLVAWQEKIEEALFGPFFFGGYFGIRSEQITETIFNLTEIPIPSEPSPFWGRHCYYEGYQFVVSPPNMRTSSRRLWFDTTSFFSGPRDTVVRQELRSQQQQIEKLRELQARQPELITARQKHFAQRLLFFLLDALFYERKVSKKHIVLETLEKAGQFLNIPGTEMRVLASLSFNDALQTVCHDYEKKVFKKIAAAYSH